MYVLFPPTKFFMFLLMDALCIMLKMHSENHLNLLKCLLLSDFNKSLSVSNFSKTPKYMFVNVASVHLFSMHVFMVAVWLELISVGVAWSELICHMHSLKVHNF